MKIWAQRALMKDKIHNLEAFYIKRLQTADESPIDVVSPPPPRDTLDDPNGFDQREYLKDQLDLIVNWELYEILKWGECPNYVLNTWYYVDGVYMSRAAFERFKRLGVSALPRYPRRVDVTVFCFFDDLNFRKLSIDIDIDNDTPVDVARKLVARSNGGFDIGLGFSGGEMGSGRCLYKSIDAMAYTDFYGTDTILEKLKAKDGNVRIKLYSTVHPYRHENDVPQANKAILTGKDRTLADFGVQVGFPIVTVWDAEPGDQWKPDWYDVLLDIIE